MRLQGKLWDSGKLQMDFRIRANGGSVYSKIWKRKKFNNASITKYEKAYKSLVFLSNCPTLTPAGKITLLLVEITGTSLRL